MKRTGLDIRLLGALDVRSGNRALPLPRSRKTRALLGYLVATERLHSREVLCDLLFEGAADPRAGLRWSLSKLRLLLEKDGAVRIVTRRDRIGFEPHGATVDLPLARKLAAPNPAKASTEKLRKAAALFRGYLLEGLDLPACYGFETWRAAEREAAHRLHETILRALIERLRDQPEAALPYARDRLLGDPLSEEAHIDFVRILAAMGRKEEALEQYRRCRHMLESEFHTQPSQEMEILRRSLSAVRPSRTPPARKRLADSSSLPPLAGRRSESALLKAFVAQDEAGTPEEILLITGPPGIGKTRMLRELAVLVEAGAGMVLTGCAFDVERIRPYTAWIDALRKIPADRIPQALHRELAPLLPELGPAPDGSTDRNRLFHTVFRVLETVAAEKPPVFVLLDDLHWFDEASAALTHYIARTTTASSVRFACAARSGEMEENPAARRLVHTFCRGHRLRQLDLAPLNMSDTVELAQNIDRKLDADRVFTESGGNPLFALEVARALKQGKDARSDTLDGLLDERLNRLDSHAREILSRVAALGRGCTVDFLSRLTETSQRELIGAIETLERHELFQMTASGSYDFTHDLVRRAAYRRLSPPLRRLNHLEIARRIAGTGDLEEAKAGEIAHHASLGGDLELTARACVAGGRHSLGVCAYEETAALAERGLEHVSELSSLPRIPLHLELLALYVHPDMAHYCPPDLKERLRRVTREARRAGQQVLVRRGFQLLGWLYYHKGDFQSALKATSDAQEAAHEADPATVVHAIAATSHCYCLLERNLDRAEKLADEARSLAEEFNVEIEGFELAMARAMLLQHAGDLDEAFRFAEEAYRRSRHNPLPWARTHCLSRLIMIELERERAAEALSRCRELRAITADMEEGSEAPFAAALEALARIAAGENGAAPDLDDAVRRLRQVDSKWMLAYAQNEAAVHDLAAGEFQQARRRATDALAASKAVDYRSEGALARAILIRTGPGATETAGSKSKPNDAITDLAGTRNLSARARRLIRRIKAELGGHGNRRPARGLPSP